MRKLIFALVPGVVAACSTPQGNSALECGGGGAAAALILCKLAGGNNTTCAAFAVGAGAAGAAICYSYADNIQRHRKELAGKENNLDARVRYLQEVNKDTEDLNRQLAAKVSAVTKSTDQAVAALKNGQTTQAQLAQERQALDKEVSAAQTQVTTAANELESAKRFQARQAAGTSAALDTEIARLQGLLAQAQGNTSALADQRMRL